MNQLVKINIDEWCLNNVNNNLDNATQVWHLLGSQNNAHKFMCKTGAMT